MADNVRGGSTDTGLPNIATDDVSGVHYQKVKLDLGGDGVSSPVSGSVPVSDNGGTLSVDDGAGSLTVDGSVSLAAAIPAGTNNIGDVDVLTLPALPAGTNNIGDVDVLTLPALPAGTNNIGDVDVLTLPALPAGNNNIGDVDIVSVPAPLSTTGGGTEATAHRVTIANDSTGVLSVDDNGSTLSIDDGGGTITVDGTVTATASGDHTVVGKAADGAAVSGNPVLVAGQDGTNVQSIKTDAAGELQVDVLTLPALVAGTANIGDVDVLTLPALPAGTNNIGDVDVLTLPAIPAGTNNIGDVDIASIAAGDNNIGNVDVVTMPDVVVTQATPANLNARVVGQAAHDAAASGNPLPIAAVANDTDDTAPPNRVSAEGDVVRLAADRDGSLFVRPHGPQLWSYHEDSSSALTDASVHAAPGAGLSLYVTDIVVSTGAATALNVFFEEGATKVLGPYYLEAVAGRGFAVHLITPKKITANTALTVTTSAAIAHAIDVTGYVAQG